MTETTVHKDPEAMTMTITSDFAAPIGDVWELWADPRKLERWWGPPTYPATFVDHDLTPGGTMNYFMTGPEGDRSHGWWKIVTVDAPTSVEFEDGFSDGDGVPNTDMPTMVIDVAISEQGTDTRMAVTTRFPSAEAMEQMISMGMEDGMMAAIGQIDEILGVTT